MTLYSIKNIYNVVMFRADAGADIGYGHVMRCLSLARALRKMKMRCIFVSCNSVPHKVIAQNGFELFVLNTDEKEMLSELEKVRQLIGKLSPRFIVVDSYRVSSAYMRALRELAPLIYIDDVKAFPYPCDVLVNYNIYGEDWLQDYQSGQAEFATKLLLGLQYVPLREEFACCLPHTIRWRVKNILVSTGGADTQNMTRRTLALIRRNSKWCDIQFHFLVGALNPYKHQIKEMASKMGNVKLHFQAKNISGLMQACDMAVSAAGSTLYELCACGTPTVTYILADNQISGAKAFAEQELILVAGDCRYAGFEKKLSERMETMISSRELRQVTSKRMQSHVDGTGAMRLAGDLLKLY